MAVTIKRIGFPNKGVRDAVRGVDIVTQKVEGGFKAYSKQQPEISVTSKYSSVDAVTRLKGEIAKDARTGSKNLKQMFIA